MERLLDKLHIFIEGNYRKEGIGRSSQEIIPCNHNLCQDPHLSPKYYHSSFAPLWIPAPAGMTATATPCHFPSQARAGSAKAGIQETHGNRNVSHLGKKSPDGLHHKSLHIHMFPWKPGYKT